MPVVEIFRFPAREAFIVDQRFAEPVLCGIASSVDAQIESFYYGLQVEDKKTGFLVLSWESPEHYEKHTSNPCLTSLIADLSLNSPDGEKRRQFVPFNTDTASAFNAPVTEFTFMNTKEGVAQHERESALDDLKTALSTLKGFRQPAVWGEIKDELGTFVYSVGWESVEDHIRLTSMENVQALLGKLTKTFNFEVAHVSLTRIMV